MARRLTQAQKKKKEVESQVTSELIDQQIQSFLKEGGKIDKIAQGESGMISVAEKRANANVRR